LRSGEPDPSGKAGLRIDAIVVDEAHEIGEPKRGQTLERALSIALARFPNARLFFSSPLRSNPELLLRLFGRDAEGESFVEHLSPVTQNIINIYKVDRSVKTARMELMVENDVAALGTVDLPFRFRNKYMGKFAFHFTNPDDTSIIYCSEPAAADSQPLHHPT
jgi:hypothetical protein